MNQFANISSDAPETTAPEETASIAVTMAPLSPRKSAAQDKPQTASQGLSQADALLLHRTLIAQEDGLARRADLTELHKRIVQMLQSLNKAMGEGIGEAMAKKAAEDRTGLTARIDTLEDAVNRMEGALRIEFEPVLRRAVAEVMAETARPRRRLGRQVFWTGLVLAAGLALGTAYHGELLAFAQRAAADLAALLG